MHNQCNNSHDYKFVICDMHKIRNNYKKNSVANSAKQKSNNLERSKYTKYKSKSILSVGC